MGGLKIKIGVPAAPATTEERSDAPDWARFRRQILVVCHGNVCRSPFAAASFAARLPSDTWYAQSAGTHAIPGSAPTARVLRGAADFDVDLAAHRARQLEAEQVRGSGFIFVMSRRQARAVAALEPAAAARTRLLGAFAPSPNLWGLAADPSEAPADEQEIADPIDQSSELHQQCFERIGAAVEEAVAWLLHGAVPARAPASADQWSAPGGHAAVGPRRAQR